jgi:retinol dehydrogenase 12
LGRGFISLAKSPLSLVETAALGKETIVIQHIIRSKPFYNRLETCKALAKAGAKVILCSRSVSAAEKAVAEEICQPGEGGYTVDKENIVIKQLDLVSLASIKAFADDFKKTETRLDYLVLNAGIMALPSIEYTDAGFEKQIGVNHFGHFYLTRLLLPMMQKDTTSAGRVVVLSSTAHTMGGLDCKDLHFKNRSYRAWVSYGQSKLANLLFAKELADRTVGTHVTAVSVHPGVIQTNLWRASAFNRLLGRFIKDKTVPQGAATTLYGCLSPRMDTLGTRGAYLSDCAPVLPSKEGEDADKKLRQELWKVTEEQLDAALAKAGLQ